MDPHTQLLVATLMVSLVHFAFAVEAHLHDKISDACEKASIGLIYLGMTYVKALEVMSYSHKLVV